LATAGEAPASDQPTVRLAEYAVGLQSDQIPDRVLQQLKLHLLDATGAAIFGIQQPWTQIVHRVVAGWGGTPQATVWNAELRMPAANAAFINSVATHAFELDDRRIASYMHPASATLPAAMAVSDAVGGVSGRDLLTAIVVGYEVGLRIGMATGRGAFDRGFYSPGLGGAFAAAVTASRLWNLTREQTTYAINLAATQASGLYSPTMMKRFNLGRGTYNGVVAAEFARAGFTGVTDALESEFGGFCAAYANDPDLNLLVEGLGDAYEIANVELKPSVSSRPNHTSIDCILELSRQHKDITAEAIERIEIETSTANHRFGADFAVDSVPAALMSVAYCVAVALLDGTAFLDQFTDERLKDPQLQDLVRRTEVMVNPDFDRLGLEKRDMTTVRCYLKDGQVFEASRAFARGHPTEPLSESEVIDKFRTLVERRIDSGRSLRLQALILGLDSVEDTTELSRVLEGDGLSLEAHGNGTN
jgi:aconitate decarboxylase